VSVFIVSRAQALQCPVEYICWLGGWLLYYIVILITLSCFDDGVSYVETYHSALSTLHSQAVMLIAVLITLSYTTFR